MRKAPGGGVLIFASLAQKTEKKPKPPGAFPEKPLYTLVLNEMEFTMGKCNDILVQYFYCTSEIYVRRVNTVSQYQLLWTLQDKFENVTYADYDAF